jgi:hypothetical protein
LVSSISRSSWSAAPRPLEANPVACWRAFHDGSGQYQGALEGKDRYIRTLKRVHQVGDGYDFTKLELLLEHIVAECVALATDDVSDN